MNLNNKILPVALVAALLGGSAGAFMMRPSKTTDATVAGTSTTKSLTPVASSHETTTPTEQSLAANDEQVALTASNSTDQREAYREGFAEGIRAAREEGVTSQRTVVRESRVVPQSRVVYRNAPRATRTRYATRSSARQVYYDYEQPRKRSFWQKHRDKLTVAMGAGGGALVGGLVGGKKGAAIGALAGGGGSALYTYKIRKRDRRY
ncbi:MAG TPA: hypothetical protein VGB73_00085 [Pyrinomonadaceae bacterium]|jgi:hypothetical protein